MALQRLRPMLMLAGLFLAQTQCSASPPLTPLPPAPPPRSDAPANASATAPSWQPTPDAPFRATAPEPGAEQPWTAPIPSEFRLANGMRVLMVPRTTLPIVVVRVVSPRGADEQAAPGYGSFMGAMLEQGTTSRSALEISDAYRDIGAEHGAWTDWDATTVAIQTLPQHVGRGIEIMADIVRNPAFAQDEIDRLRSRTIAAIQQQKDRPAVLLHNAIARSLYPGHPYGESMLGTEASLKSIDRAGLRGLYRNIVAPSETFVVVVGNTTTDTVRPLLEKAFEGWKQWSPPRRKVRTPADPTPSILVVNRPDAAQSNIAIATVGVPRTTPDFDAVLMANTILGGMFSSRLNLNLREKHSFTYGARSQFDMRHGPGPVVGSAAVDTPNTGAALRETLNELERFCSAPVDASELQLALGYQVKSLPGRFESAGATAGAIGGLGVFGLPLEEFRTRPERLGKITAQDVQRAAAAHLDPSHMRIVLVGDLKVVRQQLIDLAFGSIDVVDDQGKKVEHIDVPKPHRAFHCKAP